MDNWNHNTHYHDFILSKLPDTCSSALDIGSGLGLFSSKLAYLFDDVYGLEPDPMSLEYSNTNYRDLKNIHFIKDTFLEHDFGEQMFDFISAIASIHHMDFTSSLARMISLLNPKGKIVILGLYKESSLGDFLFSLVSIIPNLIRNLLSLKNEDDSPKMIVTPATMTIREMKNSANIVLDSYTFRRHLFWRYSIEFEKKN